MRVLRFPFAILTLLALILSGCQATPASKVSTPAEVNTPAAKAAEATTPLVPKELVKVKLAIGGSKNSILYLPPVFAEVSGFFKDEGIDIEIAALAGGAQAQQALVSGEVDFTSMAVEHAVKAQTQGVDLVMLSLYWRYPTVAIVVDSKYKDEIKSIKDLKGKKIGVTSPGSGSHKVLLSALSMHGVQASEVEIVGTGMPGMINALKAGTVHAASNYDPFITDALQQGLVFSLWDTRSKKDTETLYGGEYPFVGLVTRRDVIEKKPELVEKVTRALVRANNFLTASTAEAVAAKLPVEVKGNNESLYIQALKANQEAFSPDGKATEKGLMIVIESLKQDGVIPQNSNIKPGMVFDGSFAQKR